MSFNSVCCCCIHSSRDQHHGMGMTGSMKNLGGVQPQDDNVSGDETSAFLGTPNSVSYRFPERGILKKIEKEDNSLSDNNDMCEVEATLKSLNGYHEGNLTFDL